MKNETNESKLDGYKIALAVRQLEITGITHECYDIKEEGIENILIQYGIFYKWNNEEKEMMKNILMEMAAKEEIKEAIRWAQMEHDPIILRVPNKPIPSPRVLELQQNIFKAEMKKKREREVPDPNEWGDMLLKEQKLGVI